MLDIEPSDSYPRHMHTYSHQNKIPQNVRGRKKETGWLCGKGGTKWHPPFVSGKEKEVHVADQAKQMGTCWPSGVDLRLTADKAGGFWCLFSCWFSFPRGLGPDRVVPTSPHRSRLNVSQQLPDLRQKTGWTIKKITKVEEGLLL